MKFGGVVATKIDDWQIFPYLEDLGYDSAWAPDSQMIWSDCYVTDLFHGPEWSSMGSPFFHKSSMSPPTTSWIPHEILTLHRGTTHEVLTSFSAIHPGQGRAIPEVFSYPS